MRAGAPTADRRGRRRNGTHLPRGEGRFRFQNTENFSCTAPIPVTTTTTLSRCEPPYLGGYYGRDLKVLPEHLKGCERHHMPSEGGVKRAGEEGRSWSRWCGPAITMKVPDHRRTGSNGAHSPTPPQLTREEFQQKEASIILGQDPVYPGAFPNYPGAFSFNAADVAALPGGDQYAAAVSQARPLATAAAIASCRNSPPQDRAYSSGGVPYHLVLGTDGGDPSHASHACMETVAILNPTVVFASENGLIGRVRGTVPAETPPGPYQLCFKDSSPSNSTGTGGATFTVI